MELENGVASCRCVPATFGRACRYYYQEGRSRTRRRLSRQLDLRTTKWQRQEVKDLEDYVVVCPRRCRAQARSRRTGAERSRASARAQRSFALMRTARRPSGVTGGPFSFSFVSASVRGIDLDQRCVPQLKRRWASRCRNSRKAAQQRLKRRYTIVERRQFRIVQRDLLAHT